MNISELSINRPVLATVMNLAIIIFGVVGLTFLAVRDYPAIDPPQISVSTSYTGANSDIIESQITEPLEKPNQRNSGHPYHHLFQLARQQPDQRRVQLGRRFGSRCQRRTR